VRYAEPSDADGMSLTRVVAPPGGTRGPALEQAVTPPAILTKALHQAYSGVKWSERNSSRVAGASRCIERDARADLAPGAARF
jgi:hypothetical protein